MMQYVQAMIDRSIATARRFAARAVLQLIDGAYVCSLHGVHGEAIRKAELFQHYGFSSVPLAGAEIAALFVGGDGGHCILVAEQDRRTRPALASGESALWDAAGKRVWLTAGGFIVLASSPSELSADEAIARKKDLQQLADDLKTQINLSLAGCQSGGGVQPIQGVTAQASALGRCQ